MESLKPDSQKELQELLLLYDNIEKEAEENGMDDELAQRLYDIYGAITVILKDNLK